MGGHKQCYKQDGETEAQSMYLGCPWCHHSSLKKTQVLEEPASPGVAPGAGKASSGLDQTPEDAAPEPPHCPPCISTHLQAIFPF